MAAFEHGTFEEVAQNTRPDDGLDMVHELENGQYIAPLITPGDSERNTSLNEILLQQIDQLSWEMARVAYDRDPQPGDTSPLIGQLRRDLTHGMYKNKTAAALALIHPDYRVHSASILPASQVAHQIRGEKLHYMDEVILANVVGAAIAIADALHRSSRIAHDLLRNDLLRGPQQKTDLLSHSLEEIDSSRRSARRRIKLALIASYVDGIPILSTNPVPGRVDTVVALIQKIGRFEEPQTTTRA